MKEHDYICITAQNVQSDSEEENVHVGGYALEKRLRKQYGMIMMKAIGPKE